MKNRIQLVTSPLSAALATLVLASSHASAASQAWTNTGTVSGNWSETTNWGGNIAPGATSGNASTDVATFNTAAGTYGTSANPILIDTYRNISGLTFNGSVGNYTIGTTGGNALHMTSGGSILIGNGLTSNNTTITINAPLLMYGGLTINNQAPNLTNKIVIGGNITSATAGAKTLSINSVTASSTNINEITGLISDGNGTVSVTQSSSGGLWRLLNDANSFTGNLSVEGGTVFVSSIGDQGVNSAAGAGNIINIGSTTSCATLTYTGNAVTTNRTINMAGTTGNTNIVQNGSGLLKFTSNITVTGAGNKTLALRGTGAGEIAGNIVNHAGGNWTAVSKTEANTWTLSGTNTYSGNTTVSGGILTFANTASKSSSSNVTATSAGAVGLGVGGAGYYTAANVGTLFNTGNFTGISLNAASGVAIDTTNAGGTFDQSTALNNATRTLTKLGTGTLVLSASNTLSNTTISAGTLRVANANALGSGTSALAVNDGTLDLNGNSVTVGALSGTGSSAIVTSGAAGSVTLTSNTTSSTTYAGSIQDGSGKVGLTKSGAGGTLTLTGNSSYTGLTTVSGNGSILAITNANALGASGIGNGTTVNTGARLQLSNNITLTESLTISSIGSSNNGGLISAGGNNTISSAITLGAQSRFIVTSGTLTLAGGVNSSNFNLTLGATASNATVNITSAINLGSGAFNAYAGAGITNSMTVLGVTGNNFSQVRTDTGGTIRTDVANAWNASANMVLGSSEASAQTNTFNLNGNSQSVANLTSANDVSTGGNATNIITSASAATLTMNGTAGSTYAGQITNAMALTKAGNNTQVLTGNNSYSGATSVNAGVLNIRHNNALGSTAGGTTVSSNAALQLQGNITVTGEALSLSGGGISNANGALRSMSGNNTWAGDITIGAPTTRIASDAGLLTISGNITGTSGNSTALQGNGNILVSGTISGAQSVTTSTATLGVVTLEAANTFTGAMSIIGGTVSANSIKDYNTASSLGKAGSGNIVIGGFGISGTLLYTGTGDASNRTFQIGTNTGPPALATDTGSATIQNDGSGALVFTATIFNSSTNATTGAGADRTLTLRGSNTGNNTISGVIRDNIVSGSATGTARVGLIKNGAGKWILGGNNTYTGGTTVSEGTLTVNGRIASGVTVNTGATLGGSGTISGNSTIAGSLNPGNSPGLLTFENSVTLESTASTTMEIVGSGPRGVDYDAVTVGGALVYGGTLTLDFSGPAYGEGVYNFNLFDFASQSGSFTSMSLAGLYSGALINNAGIWGYTEGDNTWSFNQGDGVLTFTVVPEPNVAMVVGSLALMTLLRRRRD